MLECVVLDGLLFRDSNEMELLYIYFFCFARFIVGTCIMHFVPSAQDWYNCLKKLLQLYQSCAEGMI